jgi:hypothetical protein
VNERLASAGQVALSAGEAGPHLLALRVEPNGVSWYTHFARISLVEGQNRLALDPVELPGLIVCATDRSELLSYARSRRADGSEVLVHISNWPEARRPKGLKGHYLYGCTTPAGRCDLLRIEGGAFVVVLANIEVAVGDPTLVRF